MKIVPCVFASDSGFGVRTYSAVAQQPDIEIYIRIAMLMERDAFYQFPYGSAGGEEYAEYSRR